MLKSNCSYLYILFLSLSYYIAYYHSVATALGEGRGLGNCIRRFSRNFNYLQLPGMKTQMNDLSLLRHRLAIVLSEKEYVEFSRFFLVVFGRLLVFGFEIYHCLNGSTSRYSDLVLFQEVVSC